VFYQLSIFPCNVRAGARGVKEDHNPTMLETGNGLAQQEELFHSVVPEKPPQNRVFFAGCDAYGQVMYVCSTTDDDLHCFSCGNQSLRCDEWAYWCEALDDLVCLACYAEKILARPQKPGAVYLKVVTSW
jgi:hypothetical protein